MRRVEYFEYKRELVDGKLNIKKTKVGEATFHQFGIDYEEFETGPGNYTTAILELDDGTVISVEADRIKFVTNYIDEVIGLIRSGNKINAIKRHRELFGSSLKEAKEACDKLRVEMKAE